MFIILIYMLLCIEFLILIKDEHKIIIILYLLLTKYLIYLYYNVYLILYRYEYLHLENIMKQGYSTNMIRGFYH